MQKIPYVNLAAQWQLERDELLPIIEKVLASGQYIGGGQVEEFERQAALLCQTKHCVALNSGTDALVFGLLALGVGPGDEVITPPNSFVASTAAIVHIGAKPVFVDVLPDQNIDPGKLEAAISPATKAIMPVHLTGRMARMDEIQAISAGRGIPVIEDAAQAIGSKYMDIPSGKWGKVGCFSTHPLKNLNACGDGGFLVTDDDEIARQVRLMRNHGLADRNTVERFGNVSRMDALQAAILNFRIARLESVTAARRRNAAIYRELLDRSKVYVADDRSAEFNTYHTFVVQVGQRDQLRQELLEAGIETAVHYPVPIHLQPAAKNLGCGAGSFPVTERQAGRILTLPVHQYLSADDVAEIARQVNRLCRNEDA
jgi:dTDP-4-amino-4,6-dideoxygalactose transaminase